MAASDKACGSIRRYVRRLPSALLALGVPLGVAAVFFGGSPVTALPEHLARFASDPLSSPEFRNKCGTCHVNPAGGGERNEFGKAFAAARFTITPDLRAHFPDRFQYPIQALDANTEVHYADPDGRTIVIKKDGAFTVIDPAKHAPSRAVSAATAAPAQRPQKGPDWAALLPEGEGRRQTVATCGSCHTLKYIVGERRADEAGWMETIDRMMYADGAFIPDEEIPVIAHYLAAHFGTGAPLLPLPVNINTAPAEVLRMFPGMTDEAAARLVAAREKETIADSVKLESILGRETADRIRSLVVFK